MKRFLELFIAGCIIALTASACTKNSTGTQDAETPEETCELKLKETSMKLSPGETKMISLSAKTSSETSFKTYNWSRDIYGLSVTCDKPEMIKIDKG